MRKDALLGAGLLAGAFLWTTSGPALGAPG
jgi:hypothetical protein